MKNRLVQFLIVAIVGVFMVVASTAMAADTIKLGVAGAHSGDLASYGIPTVNAAELVVEDINAKGGFSARRSNCWWKTMSASRKWPPTPPPSWFPKVWTWCSGTSAPAPPRRRWGSTKTPRSWSCPRRPPIPALTQSGDYPNFFRTIASDDAQARLEVDFALDILGLKKIAVIHDKGDYGKGLAEFAKEFLEADPTGGSGPVRRHHPGRGGLLAVVQKIKRVRRRGGDFRRLSSRGLQDRHPDAQKEHGYHFHLR